MLIWTTALAFIIVIIFRRKSDSKKRVFVTEKPVKSHTKIKPAKVVIVGGGIGGVSAAYFLRKTLRENDLQNTKRDK